MAKSKTISPSVSFPVDSVTVGKEPLPTEKAHISIKKLLGTSIEACDNYHADVIEQPGFHSLIAAVHLAYTHHFPLVLSPDVLWLTIAQGLANHVNNHSEELRSRLVPHEGKNLIRVRRDDFVKGSPENPWAQVWSEFSKEIEKVLGHETHSLILNDFSTTGPTERAASEVVLMDCVQSYFSYEFTSRCGIPTITLEGTADDWEKIQQRVEYMEKFDLKWWASGLRQIAAEFVSAAQRRPNQAFWQAIYKQTGASGGPYTSGWLVQLLPYLKNREFKLATEGDYGSGYYTPWQTNLRNPWVGKPLVRKPKDFEGITDNQLPSSASQVPFVWDYLERQYDYQFVAGVLSIKQDKETRAIRPQIGWAVRPTFGAG